MYKISNMSFFEKSYNKWLKDYYGVVDSELDYWNCIGFLFEVKKNKKLDFNNKRILKDNSGRILRWIRKYYLKVIFIGLMFRMLWRVSIWIWNYSK